MSILCEFALPIVPTPKMRQRARVFNGHATTYTSPAQKANADSIIALMSRYAPKSPASGPLRLDILCCMPIPKSMTKRDREGIAALKTLPYHRPDQDNLLKQIMDAMTRLRFWEDDAQVCLIATGKIYSETPCWLVRLSKAEPDSLWRLMCSGWTVNALKMEGIENV